MNRNVSRVYGGMTDQTQRTKLSTTDLQRREVYPLRPGCRQQGERRRQRQRLAGSQCDYCSCGFLRKELRSDDLMRSQASRPLRTILMGTSDPAGPAAQSFL